MMFAVILSFLAAVATWAGIARFRLWAERRQIIDLPNERSSHTRPTPLGGGLIIVAVTLSCGLLLALTSLPGGSWITLLPFLGGALLVAAVSWLDDLRTLPSWLRLTSHTLAAGVAVTGLGYWKDISLPFLGIANLGAWGVILTMVWIVGLTNAYNFMDGIDGIAGAQAVVAGIGWAVMGWVGGVPLVGGLGLALGGSSFGFLIHNWPPARIFMGDIGSAFLGYTLAILPVMYGSCVEGSSGIWAVGLLLVWPFVFDTLFTLMRRLRRGENVFVAHRSHLYQRMTSANSGHAGVALLYSGLALAGGLLAQVWSTRVAHGAVTVTLVLPLLCLGLWVAAVVGER